MGGIKKGIFLRIDEGKHSWLEVQQEQILGKERMNTGCSSFILF